MESHSKKFVLIIGFLGVSLGIFALLSLSIFVFFNKYVIDETPSPVYDHQILEYNPSTGEIAMGSMTSYEDIGESYVSYVNEDNTHVLISSFGSRDEYICTANCHCSDERRTGSNAIFSSGFKYLLLASSSVLAYKIAHDHFLTECEEDAMINSLCPSGSQVIAEVESCQMAAEVSVGDDGSMLTHEGEEVPEEITVIDSKDVEKWWCKGKCIGREESWAPFQQEGTEEIFRVQLGMTHEQWIAKRKSDYFMRKSFCESIEQEGEIQILPSKVLKTPEQLFDSDVLNPLCIEVSKNKLLEMMEKMFEGGHQDFPNQREESLKRIENSDPEMWSTCYGSLNGHNPNIKCRRTEK